LFLLGRKKDHEATPVGRSRGGPLQPIARTDTDIARGGSGIKRRALIAGLARAAKLPPGLISCGPDLLVYTLLNHADQVID